MIPVLLDTNVLAGGIVGANLNWQTPPAQIRQRWFLGQFELLISEHVLTELVRVFERPWFIARLDEAARENAINHLNARARMISLTQVLVGVASHPADDFVLSAAVAGKADYLVTGDAKFRRVGEYQSVKLRTPAEFLRELDAHAP